MINKCECCVCMNECVVCDLNIFIKHKSRRWKSSLLWFAMALCCVRRLLSINRYRYRLLYHHLQKNRNSTNTYMGFQSFGCSIDQYGAPLKSCNIVSDDVHFNNNSNELLVKMHASPINPSDINIIEGKYALLPKSLPSIVGNEGIMEVKKKGKLCTSQPKIGELVIPSTALLGTWQQYLTCKETDIIPLNININDFEKYDQHFIAQLSMIAVNPCTAYRMINDFVSLQEGDYIIQNAANSAVGECVIQIARNYGLKTINIIRGSIEGTDYRSIEQFKIIKEHLYNLGADHVIGDIDLQKMSKEEREKLCNKKPPKLGLNAVGGDIVSDMMKLMTNDKKSMLVTYGGMSKKPLIIPTAPLIFRDIQLTGFWMTKWKKECEIDKNLKEEYLDMISTITQMIKDDDLEMAYKLIKFGDNGQGMMTALKYATNAYDLIGRNDKKHILDINDNQTPQEIRGKIIMIFDEYM